MSCNGHDGLCGGVSLTHNRTDRLSAGEPLGKVQATCSVSASTLEPNHLAVRRQLHPSIISFPSPPYPSLIVCNSTSWLAEPHMLLDGNHQQARNYSAPTNVTIAAM